MPNALNKILWKSICHFVRIKETMQKLRIELPIKTFNVIFNIPLIISIKGATLSF